MGYFLLAVMFYTIVRFGVDVWAQMRDETTDIQRDYGFGHELRVLKERVTELEKD